MKHLDTSRWEGGPTAARRAASAPIDDFGYLEPRPATPALAERLLGLPAIWLERTRRRRALARTLARDLKDAGLSLEGVAHELARPFWRPLDAERK